MSNFETKIKRAIRDAESALQQAKALESRYEESKDFTVAFLEECAESGITKVAIGVSHPSVPSSTRFPFGPGGSVFQFVPKRKKEAHRWPAIWGVCERMGVHSGCGNSDQCQADTTNLIDGVYHLKNGAWKKVSEN